MFWPWGAVVADEAARRGTDGWAMTSLRMFSVWDGGWKLGERVRLDGDEKLGKRG